MGCFKKVEVEMTEVWVLVVTENPAQNRDAVIEGLTKFLEKKYYVKVVGLYNINLKG
jgi:hypothetical protein